MSKHDLDQMDTTGYFLPEDSQFRLKKLHGHMVFLSQLAQPRMHDEEREWAPEISTGELAVCLELLAEQAGRVLDEVSWPAERCTEHAASHEADDAEAHDDEVREEAHERKVQPGEAPPAEPLAAEAAGQDAAKAPPGTERLLFGMTLEQADELDRLLNLIHAHGDVVHNSEEADMAIGTVSAMGQAIFDDAMAAQEIMEQVTAQRLPWAPKLSPRVREEPAAYNAGIASPAVERTLATVAPMTLARHKSGHHQPHATRLH
jgi:hypothetical protein